MLRPIGKNTVTASQAPVCYADSFHESIMTEQTRTTQDVSDVTAFLPARLLPCASSENLDLFEMERSLLIDSSPKNQKCDPSFAMKHTSDISIRRHVLSE